MSEARRYSKESFIYVFGETLSKSLAFVLLPIYTNYLPLEEFAVLSLVTTLWPLVVVFLGAGFSAYLIRGYYEADDSRRFFGTLLGFSMLVGGVLAALIHLIGPWLCELVFDEVTYRPFLQYAVYFAVFRLYFNHVVSCYRARRQPRTAVLLSLVLFGTNLVAVLTAIYGLDAGLAGILNAQLLAYMLVAVVYTVKILPELSFKPQWSVLVPAVLFVLPLVPHAFSGWVVNHVGKVFIETNMSLADLSVYSVAVQLAVILNVVNTGLNQAWTPFVYANYGARDSAGLLGVSARRTILLVLVVALALVLFTRELLLLMGKEAYLAATRVLPVLVLGYLFQMVYFIFVAIILYNKRSVLLPLISISSGLVTIGLNFVLVPRLGMFGAALSTDVAFFLMACLAFGFARRYRTLPILNREMFWFLAAAVAVTWISVAWLQELTLLWHVAVNLFLLLALGGLLVRLGLLNLQNIRDLIRGTRPFTFS